MKEPRPGRGLIRQRGVGACKFALSVIASFVAVAAFASLLTGEALRRWVSGNSYPVFIALVVTALAALATGHYAYVLSERNRRLERELRSREAAREKSPGAAALLELLALFGPAPVTEEMLQAGAARPPAGPLERLLSDPDYLAEAASALSGMSLADVDRAGGWIRLRRAVQESARGQLSLQDPDAASALAKLAQSILAASDPGEPDRDAAEDAYRRSRPHLVGSGATRSPDPQVRQLVINQIRRLYRAGGYDEGVALGEPSLSHWREEFGADDRQTLLLAVEVGAALRRLGRPEAAAELNLETLGRLSSRYGPADQAYLLCARSRAIDLALLGDYAAALRDDQGLIPAFNLAFGPDHLETLQLRNDTAISLRCVGKFAEALEHDRFALSRRREILGPDDTGTLTSRFAIARDLRMLGRIGEGHEAIAEVSSILGRKPVASLQFRLLVEAEIAVSLRRCGRYPEALARAEAVLGRYEEALGPEHRETLRAGLNVIHDLRIAGRLPDAEDLGRRLTAGWESAAGPGHPNTLAAQAALACVLRARGDPEAALQADEECAAMLAEQLGEAHPSVLAVLTNIASDLAAMGEAGPARQAGERSLRLHRESRGVDHPSTLATAANLSLDLRASGDRTPADALRADTLRAAEAALGADHPDVLMIARRSRITLDIEPMMD